MSRHVDSRLQPRLRLLAAVVAIALLAAGCGKDEPTVAPPVQGIVPDFSLTDVNPNSTTSGQAVSPRQQLTKVSAWYFGHAT